MDTDSAEAIYVCTDMVRTSDSFPFFICDDQEETLVCANIKRSCSYGPPSISKMSNNWSLECTYVSSSSSSSSSKAQLCNGNGLLNVRVDCDNISGMEICVAGRDSNHNSPVILSSTLQLISTRRVARHCRRNSYSTLDVILEHDENENDADNGDGYDVFGYESTKEGFMVDSNLSRQVLALSFCLFLFFFFFSEALTLAFGGHFLAQLSFLGIFKHSVLGVFMN